MVAAPWTESTLSATRPMSAPHIPAKLRGLSAKGCDGGARLTMSGYPRGWTRLLEFPVEISNQLVWFESFLCIKVEVQVRSSWSESKSRSAGSPNNGS
jgi:hypothetical protein